MWPAKLGLKKKNQQKKKTISFFFPSVYKFSTSRYIMIIQCICLLLYVWYRVAIKKVKSKYINWKRQREKHVFWAVSNWIRSLGTQTYSVSSEQHRAIRNPVYTTQISNWLANVNFYSVAMGYHVVWFDTELQTLLISSIQFCPSLCITEPSGHLFTNKPLMAQIFSSLSLWHGRKCLHLSTRLDMLLVSHQNSSFTGEKLRGVKTWPNLQC